ncbi:ABC transporter permease [Rhodococcus ruber]|nr:MULTISPECIES: ABC transporter permease [Rhodococcus]NGR06386.1 ABC transporter permease [bacterium SGD-2]RIK14336.1 MAG: ABC transporter permease [Acidobacteriota bacterium]ATQ31832.1 ABC transporter permease [Rhodococcus ruber]AUM19896.1 ABC transporter permease [Rhodococcus ruber]AWH01752.1 ABC transporter permease [Rhodococcus ruber]
MWDYIDERKAQIAFSAYQHVSLVVQAVLLATVVAVVLAVVVTRIPRLEPVANTLSAVGLTVPSFALLGILVPLVGIGVAPAFLAVAFYATLPVLRNAVVGLRGVDGTLVESARGIGMGEIGTLTRVRLPLAWPVILAGVRVSTQMSMGIAAIAAYVLGPGLGSFIFTGLSQIGGANALNSALVGTIGVVVLALALDALLLALGKVTVSKGIRA